MFYICFCELLLPSICSICLSLFFNEKVCPYIDYFALHTLFLYFEICLNFLKLLLFKKIYLDGYFLVQLRVSIISYIISVIMFYIFLPLFHLDFILICILRSIEGDQPSANKYVNMYFALSYDICVLQKS